MDANARKIVHELALKFNVKSKSTGSGDQRRPVLHRSKGTLVYEAVTFDRAVARVQRRFFPRLDAKGGGPRRSGVGARGGAGRSNNAAVTVRDGEVVGGSAPELAATNKGRAMLEKLGWSQGMALGSTDNKGITTPIEHIVKRSKAGLG